MAKLSYLKELLVPRVRSAVDGLPYNTEGYKPAKAILTAKYGKPNEVTNAHIQSIIALPTVQGSEPARIHDFYEKLATNMQFCFGALNNVLYVVLLKFASFSRYYVCKKNLYLLSCHHVTAKTVISLKIQQNIDLLQRVTLKNVDFRVKPLKF